MTAIYYYWTTNQNSEAQNQEIQALLQNNGQLKETIDSIDNAFREYRSEAEEKQRDLELKLERERNINVHLMHDINPLYNTYNSYPSAEDQRY